MKDKKGVTIVNLFQSILKDSNNRKPSKIWVDKGSEFYNNFFLNWLQDNNTEIYSAHNKGKFVVAERFIRTLKKKFYKCMTLTTSKNVYIDKLDDIVNKYNNTYRRTIKMKSYDVKDSTYINIDKEVNNNFFNSIIFVIKELKNTVPWTYVINDIKGGQTVIQRLEHSMKKNFKTQIKKN